MNSQPSLNGKQSNSHTGGQGRGFAAMDPQKRSQIASMGGSASPGNFKNDPQRAARAGRKGGSH